MTNERQVGAGLPAHIVALLDPAAYPHPVDGVELVQTHISYVLMAGDMVYKLKKPLDLGFLNFSTLRRRHYYCRQEVRLNRRLCSDTYLGVVPVMRHGDQYRIGGAGQVVDYAVQMRRLPSDRMMDNLLDAGQIDLEMVDRLANVIADFHARSGSGPAIDRFGSIRTIERNWRENFDQTRPYVNRTLSLWQAELLETSVDAFIARHRQLFKSRIQTGRIRDCHGDLRASAVCFTDDICVYDCIEFNRRFRYSDVASEVAFLAMDLDRRGRPDLAERFVSAYQRATGDTDLLRVLDFYACYRAFVRGKVNSFQLDAAEIPPPAKASARAMAIRYFDLACGYAANMHLSVVIMMAGLSGTGKSAVAHAVASERGMHVIASDVVRKELAGIAATEYRGDAYGAGLYTEDATAKTYAAVLDRAGTLLADGQSIILDATFQQRSYRERVVALAKKSGALVFCIETIAEEPIVRKRLMDREFDTAVVSDARWETYLIQKTHFEPITELSDWQHIRLDTGKPLAVVVGDALCALDARLQPARLAADDVDAGLPTVTES